MIISTYCDVDFYETRVVSEAEIVDPEDLYEAVVHINVYLFNRGVPYKAQNWSCLPDRVEPKWTVSVAYTFQNGQPPHILQCL